MQMSTTIKKMAIVYPKAIGDFMFVLPALHSIRHAMPDVHITLVAKRKQAPLAEPQKGLLADEVLCMGGDVSWWDIRKKLRALGVDTVVDMAGNDQSGLIMAWRGGQRMRPHRLDCKGSCALYSPFAKPMPRLPQGRHRVEELLTIAQQLGATESICSFKLRIPDRAIEASEKMIAANDLHSGSVIVLNLGASRDSKRWPATHFKTLTKSLIRQGHRVVLTGAHAFKPDGNYDRKTVEQFSQDGLIDGENCIDLITDTALPPDVHLQRDTHFLRYSKIPRITIGNDTGPMQIAGSVGDDAKNATISLFGPTNWGRYAPYDPSRKFPDTPNGTWNRVLCINAECGPTGTNEACECYRNKCSHKKCMNTLSPESVMKTVNAMVNPA